MLNIEVLYFNIQYSIFNIQYLLLAYIARGNTPALLCRKKTPTILTGRFNLSYWKIAHLKRSCEKVVDRAAAYRYLL